MRLYGQLADMPTGRQHSELVALLTMNAERIAGAFSVFQLFYITYADR